jgi:hypothetical protein
MYMVLSLSAFDETKARLCMIQLSRMHMRKLHAMSGSLAILVIATFLTSTIVAELSGDKTMIATVKQAIVYGLALLVPSMVTVGISGKRLSGTSTAPIIQRKQRRMMVIAANGLLILMPCAVALAWLASSGAFGIAFAMVQGIELLAGMVNLTLLVLNARLGMQMTRQRSTS